MAFVTRKPGSVRDGGRVCLIAGDMDVVVGLHM